MHTPDEDIFLVLYLIRCALGLNKSGYIGTASNNASKRDLVFVPDGILADVVVIMPTSELPNPDELKKSFVLFDAFKKGDYSCLDGLLPQTAQPSDEYRIVVGPATLAVCYGDEVHAGQYDEAAVSALSSSYPPNVVNTHAAIIRKHNRATQASIVHDRVSKVVPPGVFKRYAGKYRTYSPDATFVLEPLSHADRKKIPDELEALELKIDLCVDTGSSTPSSPEKSTSPPGEIGMGGSAASSKTEEADLTAVQSRQANVIGLYSKSLVCTKLSTSTRG